MNWIALIIRIPDDNVVKKVLQFKVTWIGKCGRPRLKWQCVKVPYWPHIRAFGDGFGFDENARQANASSLKNIKWIPSLVDIEGNEMADFLVNEAKTLEPVTSCTTVFDANAVAKQKPLLKPKKEILAARMKL
ncbi:hypothetical protein TNCV_324111 [Trichonephila clavipes]|nr:hypothetical protein TNCV_324111 [Trichonephila clavipes]